MSGRLFSHFRHGIVAAMAHVSLHADVAAVLRENGNRWMAPDILAMAVNDRRLFRHGPGHKRTTAREIISRITVREHRGRFERNGSRIRLAGRGGPRISLEL